MNLWTRQARLAVAAVRVAMTLFTLIAVSAAAEDDSGLDGLVGLLAEVDDADFQLDLLKGIRDGLQGRKSVPMPSGWDVIYPKLAKSSKPEVREQAQLLALTFGDKTALAALQTTMLDAQADASARRAALESLVACQTEGLAKHLHRLLDDEALCSCALRGLAAYEDERTPAVIIARYNEFTPAEKQDAVATLISRPLYAYALLDAVERERIPRQDISAFSARQIDTFADEQLRRRLIDVWGEIRDASADSQALIAKYKASLTPDAIDAADVRHGRAVFKQTCGQCHRLFGDGGEIGPELTGANRANLDYILENVLTPSRAIAKDYQLKTIITVNGRLISGIIKHSGERALTVQTANEIVIIPRDDIDEINTSPLSMMPDGLWGKLNEEDVRALVKYLAGQNQSPLPEGFEERAGTGK